MDYTQYISQVRASAAVPGARQEVYIGALMMANVLSSLTGSGISGISKDYYPLFNGKIVDPGTIEDIMRVPGVSVSIPTLPSNSYGFIPAGQNMRGTLRKPFDYRYLPMFGNDYRIFIASLIALYKERVYPLGILSESDKLKISRVLNAGLAVMPVVSNARGEKWNAVVKEFDKANVLYANNMVKEGYAALERSKANIRFWNALKAITETVAAPITAVTSVAKFGFNYRNPLMAAGGAALLWVAYKKFNSVKKAVKRFSS